VTAECFPLIHALVRAHMLFFEDRLIGTRLIETIQIDNAVFEFGNGGDQCFECGEYGDDCDCDDAIKTLEPVPAPVLKSMN
jgi:hypothetical protein